MSFGCGCGTQNPSGDRIINATVCQDYFILINSPCTVQSVTGGNYGTAVIYNSNQILYTHTDESFSSNQDSFQFTCTNNKVYTVYIEISDTIPEVTQIITLTATGTCDVGTPSYTWSLPDCAQLVEGFSIHDPIINVIVPLFDPLNPSAFCEILVDVCCDFCSNCCKCETIKYYPPNCNLVCGEEPDCNCDHLPCFYYDEETNSCLPICEEEEVCCSITGTTSVTSEVKVAIQDVSYTCETNIVFISGLNYAEVTFNVYATATHDIAEWLLMSPDDIDIDQCKGLSEECFNVFACATGTNQYWYLTPTAQYLSNCTYFHLNPDGNSIKIVSYSPRGTVEDCYSFEIGVIGIKTKYQNCEAYRTVFLSYDPDPGNPSLICDSAVLNKDSIMDIVFCNVTATCQTVVSSITTNHFCADCCGNEDCYKEGCDNSNLVCLQNECWCVVGNEIIPAPTGDNECCPECISSTPLPPCYQCINNIIVPPNTNCPSNFTWNWETCNCSANDCLEYQCIVNAGTNYCPEIENCGCDDGNICIPCNTVSCTDNIDCPQGCTCDENQSICVDNPCFENQCDNPNAPLYCPNVLECGCDETDECIPCNTVDCITTEDCPFGCACDEDTQKCVDNPCATYSCNPTSTIFCPEIPNCGCTNFDECIPCNTVTCTANINCPYGCICDENTQTCSGSPCATLEADCDAQIIQVEYDLYIQKICLNNGSYLFVPTVFHEPNINTTLYPPSWEINVSNYVNGWVSLTGNVTISGGTAVSFQSYTISGNVYNNCLVINPQYFQTPYFILNCRMAGRGVRYRLNAVPPSGQVNNCQDAIFTRIGVLDCSEIYSVTSATGINWQVTEWIVNPSSAIGYSSEDILIIACQGNNWYDITANVTDGICEISTCPTSVECICDGIANCETSYIQFRENYIDGTGLWTVVADVLYDDGTDEQAYYDCEPVTINPIFGSPTCSRCGSLPYNSTGCASPTGDNNVVISPTCLDGPNQNDNCGCVCGWTYYGADLVYFDGAVLQVQVTNPLNAGVCFQTDVVGNDPSGNPCCICECFEFEHPTGCSLTANISSICNDQQDFTVLTFNITSANNSAVNNYTISTTTPSGVFTVSGQGSTISTNLNSTDLLIPGLTYSFTITEHISNCQTIAVYTIPCCETFNYTFNWLKCKAAYTGIEFIFNTASNMYPFIVEISGSGVPTGVVTTSGIVTASGQTLIFGYGTISGTGVSGIDCSNPIGWDINNVDITITPANASGCVYGPGFQICTLNGSALTYCDIDTNQIYLSYEIISGIAPFNVTAVNCYNTTYTATHNEIGTFTLPTACTQTSGQYTVIIKDDANCYLYFGNDLGNCQECSININGNLVCAPVVVSGNELVLNTDENGYYINNPFLTWQFIPTEINGSYEGFPYNVTINGCGAIINHTFNNITEWNNFFSNPINLAVTPCSNSVQVSVEGANNCTGQMTFNLTEGVFCNCPSAQIEAYYDCDTEMLNVIVNQTPNPTGDNYGIIITTATGTISIPMTTSFISIPVLPEYLVSGLINLSVINTDVVSVGGSLLCGRQFELCCNTLDITYNIEPIFCTGDTCEECIGLDYPPQDLVIGYNVYLSGMPAFYDIDFDLSTTAVTIAPIISNPMSSNFYTIMMNDITCQNLIIDQITITEGDCSFVIPTVPIYYNCGACGTLTTSGVYTNSITCDSACGLLGCSGEIVSGETIITESPYEFNLKLGGLNLGSMENAESYFQSFYPSATVLAYQNLGDNFEQILLLNVNTITSSMFANNNVLHYIEDLVGFIDTIENNAFASNVTLRSAIFPSVTYVLNNAFKGCSELKDLILPSVEYMGIEAASECLQLVSGEYSTLVSAMTACFKNNYNLRHLNLSNVSYIGASCFETCSNLEEIYLNSCIILGPTLGNESTPVINTDKVFFKCFNPNLKIYVNAYLSNVIPSGVVFGSETFYSDTDLELYYYQNSLVGNVSAQQIYLSGILFI